MDLTPPLVFTQRSNCYFHCRLFGNRSFCFEKLQEYEKALTDAELSLSMWPGWVKGQFRRGRALAGLKVSGLPYVPCYVKVESLLMCGPGVCWGMTNNAECHSST